MHLLRIGLFGLRAAFLLHLRRIDHTIEQRCHINVILLLDISDDLLLDELLGPVRRDHLGVHDALEVGLGQPRLELSEGLDDVRLDFIHRDFIAEEQVQILDLDRALVVPVDSTPHALASAAQFEDELGVFAIDSLLASQTRRHELRVVDAALLVEIHAIEQLSQLLLVGGDREQVLVLREGLLIAQRHQRVAELPVIPSFPRSTNLLERDPAIVLLVEILEEIAQTHQIVLPRTPSARLRCSDGTPRRSARPS